MTGVSELAIVKLGDGTVVRLAPSTRLSIEGGTREVRLDGRAFFAVPRTTDAQPFRAHTGAATANVLGTRFELATITAAFTDRTPDDGVEVVCAVVNARCTSSRGVVTVKLLHSHGSPNGARRVSNLPYYKPDQGDFGPLTCLEVPFAEKANNPNF